MSLFPSTAGTLTVLLVLAQSLLAADGRARFVARAPANSCLAVYSGDVAATCEAFQKTRLGETLCGPRFAPLVAELTKHDLASLLRLRPLFGFDWSDLAAAHSPGGVLVFPLDDGSLGAAWLFTPIEPIDKTPASLAAAADYFTQKGYRAATASRPGANLTIYHPPADHQNERPRVLFATATFYGVANSQAAAEALLAVQTGASLADQAAFAALAPILSGGESAPAADVSFLVKPLALWELMVEARRKASEEQDENSAANDRRASADDEEPQEDELAAAHRLGLKAIQSVAGRLRFDPGDPCEWSLEASMQVERPYQKALRILEFRPGQLPPLPGWTPADVTAAGRWRWDFPLAMKGFGNLYDQANEPGPYGEGLFEDMLDGLRDDPEGVQVDLRRDVFEQLTPEMLSISDAAAPRAAAGSDGSGATESRRWLYVAGVRDEAKIAEALTRYYKGDELVQREKLGNYDVWTVQQNASLFVEGESDSLVTVRGLALGEGQLIFSTDVDLLRSAIAEQTNGTKLSDDTAWTRLADWTATQRTDATAFESLLRLDRVLEPSYRAAIAETPQAEPTADVQDEAEPQIPLAVRMWRSLLFGAQEPLTELPWSAAPEFDALREALPRVGLILSQTDGGWSIRLGALGALEE